MKNFEDLSGKKFGKLTVIKLDHREIRNDGKRNRYFNHWLCQCECGNECIIIGNYLKKGSTISCGCYRKELSKNKLYKHGLSNTRLHKIWSGIKQRCYAKYSKDYKNYGQRNIIMCDEWKNDFKKFYDWAIDNGYKDNLTIDRIDNDGNYEPNNCRWATLEEQANNMRNNHLLTFNNKTQTMSQWAKEYNMSKYLLQHRIASNWSVERALTTPIQKHS